MQPGRPASYVRAAPPPRAATPPPADAMANMDRDVAALQYYQSPDPRAQARARAMGAAAQARIDARPPARAAIWPPSPADNNYGRPKTPPPRTSTHGAAAGAAYSHARFKTNFSSSTRRTTIACERHSSACATSTLRCRKNKF